MAEEKAQPENTLNLVGTGCPMNLVYAKVELAKMKSGRLLEIILDDGAPVNNVTRSVTEEGHHILKKDQLPDSSWSVVVRKK